MNGLLKNIEYARVLPIANQTEFLAGQVVSKTLVQNEAVSLTLFAFDKGEEIGTHCSDGDALVLALEGCGEIMIDGEKYPIRAGETIAMPSNHPHAVYATERFKMFLFVVFPEAKEQT